MKIQIQSTAFLLVMSAFLLCIVPTATFAATYTVTKTIDTADGTCDSDCSLREAVIAANSGSTDTIVVPAATYAFGRTATGEDAANEGDLDFTDTDTTTVIGAGADLTIIDPNDADRAIDILSGASVIISDLSTDDSVVNGFNGGAVQIAGTAVFTNVAFRNASVVAGPESTSYGGAIYCASGTLSITNAEFSNNIMTVSSNLMYGGAIAISSECSSTLTQLTLTSNSAFSGGGIYYQTAADTTHTLSDSMFSENAASDAGAGVVAYGSDTDLPVTIDRVTFDSNTAGSSGGGIFTQAPMDITNTTFFENGTTDDGSAGGAFGSNVSSSSPLIRIAFSTFVHNTADIAGGIYADGDTDVHLRANVFAYNTVSDVPDDCYGAITSEDYNYIGAASCTITPQANDVFDQTPPSYMFTATLRDAGGYVQTAYMWGPETVDIIPQADCEDAAGDPLDNDARGMSRPQSSYCDRGAYEKDGSDPVVTVTPGTDTLPCVTGSWTDAGATATDNFSSGLTASTEDTVDVHTAGEQIITYTSTPDSDYNTGTATRTVTVTDTLDPEITLVGSASVTIDAGETYTDAGATADDFCDGSVVVDTDNPVDTMTPGDYVVTYTAEDVSGNVTTATRSVTVSPVVPDRIRKTDIRVEKDGTDRIVKWPAADFATFYKLRITTKKGKVILLSTHLERHRKILTKKWRTQHLVEGKTYLIEVKACSEAGCSAWSNEKEWTPK